MTKRTLARIIIALLIAAVLGGASLIVANNNPDVEGSGSEALSGFFH